MMEPIAPGTEDESPIIFSSSTKQEKERERLLTVKAILPNGRYGNVFEFKYINGTEHWYCNACACPVMGWVFHHETGKRHTMALGNQNQERFPILQEPDEVPTIQVAPGEPVPPGFEGQIEKVALIQERLDVFTVGPLVALEYLLELRDYDLSKEPTYLCILCDKKGDPRTVLTHLASYKHILQYLQKHFPSCYRALAPYMTKQYKRNWQNALHEIAEAIEKKFGRLKPMPVDADKYEKDPVHYLELIAKGRHFSELSGYTFEEMINKDELTKIHDDESDKFAYNKTLLSQQNQRKKSPSPPVVANPIKKIKVTSSTSGVGTSSAAVGSRRRSLSSVSSITSSDLSDYDENKSKKTIRRSRSPPYRNRSRSHSRSPYSRRYDHHHMKKETTYYRRSETERNLMPWEKSNYRRPKSDFIIDNRCKNNKIDKMEEYKKLCKAIDNDMERVLKQHKRNPEKHPQYNDEWKKFWNKRYKELQAEAKDVSTHDFKPEWIEFWNKRIIELHQDDIKTKKDALRKRLGLPEEPAPICFKIMGKKKFDGIPSQCGSGKPIPPSALPDNDPEVIVIDDRDDESKSSRRSHSPWEEEQTPRLREKSSEKRGRYSRSPRERSWERDYKYDYPPRRERIRIVSELPWERERKSYRNEIPSYYKPPPSVMRDVTREPVLSPHRVPSKTIVVDIDVDDGEINVVAVLRLLTALEEKLGSLGPKIIDLLAQALAMEKNEANSSENLLDNEVNCVMFETVKEKLKGQLLAGLVEPIQEKAFKNAIKKTASLIHAAGERKKEREKKQPKVDPVKVPGVGTVDKAAIARQIANALVLQGKTDVTQAELEQLINAVVGMAEASRNSNKPITTANFLEQIGKSGGGGNTTNNNNHNKNKEKSPPPAPVQQEKSLLPSSQKEEKTASMEGLSDSDLQTLLQNFKDLSTEEQHGLINYLKKLEAHEPDRVERLRKFVNLGGSGSKVTPPPPPTVTVPPLLAAVVEEKKMARGGRESPFSNRLGSVNPTLEEKKVQMPIVDSDEDDYTFEDVVKSVSRNVKEKELEKERELIEESMKFDMKKDEINLDDTKILISNIMNNINRGVNNELGVDLAKTLNSLPVNMASLANIVGSVQTLTNSKPPITTMQQQSSSSSSGGNSRDFVGYGQQSTFPQTQNYASRANVNTYTSVGGVVGSYGPNQYPPRPNVAYPTLDKTKITYPNYAIYGQSQGSSSNEQFGGNVVVRPNDPKRGMFGSGTNPYTNTNNRNYNNSRW